MMSKRSDIEARGTARRLCRRGRGGAFTLIELMVVISIIALPMYGRAKMLAR